MKRNIYLKKKKKIRFELNERTLIWYPTLRLLTGFMIWYDLICQCINHTSKSSTGQRFLQMARRTFS